MLCLLCASSKFEDAKHEIGQARQDILKSEMDHPKLRKQWYQFRYHMPSRVLFPWESKYELSEQRIQRGCDVSRHHDALRELCEAKTFEKVLF